LCVSLCAVSPLNFHASRGMQGADKSYTASSCSHAMHRCWKSLERAQWQQHMHLHWSILSSCSCMCNTHTPSHPPLQKYNVGIKCATIIPDESWHCSCSCMHITHICACLYPAEVQRGHQVRHHHSR
jgi:hypothetical protein